LHSIDEGHTHIYYFFEKAVVPSKKLMMTIYKIGRPRGQRRGTLHWSIGDRVVDV